MTVESPLMATDGDRLLTGWGRTAPSRATVRYPSTNDEVAAAIREAGPRGVLARGLGRSYGDAAQSAGATVFDMTGLHRFELDIDRGTVTADAGASVDEILRAIVPQRCSTRFSLSCASFSICPSQAPPTTPLHPCT